LSNTANQLHCTAVVETLPV